MLVGCVLCLSAVACGGRAVGAIDGDDDDTGDSESGEETGDEMPPQTGELQWHTVWEGSPNWDWGAGVAIDSQGDIVVAGVTNQHPHFGEGDQWLAKFNPDGELIWSIEQDFMEETDTLSDVVIDRDDRIVVVGGMGGGNFFQQGYTAMFSTDGDEIWTEESEDGGSTEAIGLDAQDQLWIAGQRFGMMDGGSLVQKRALNGTLLDETLDGSDEGFPRNAGIEVVADGAFVVGGLFMGGPGQNGGEARIVKYADDLSIDWSESFQPEGKIGAFAVALTVDDDGSLWASGAAWGEATNEYGGWLAHFTSDGQYIEEWMISDGGGEGDGGSALAFDAWGNLVLSGVAGGQGYVIKRDDAGEVLWSGLIEGEEPLGGSAVNDFTFDAQQNIILVGHGYEVDGIPDAYVCKLAP